MTGIDAIFIMAMIACFLAGGVFVLLGLLIFSRGLDQWSIDTTQQNEGADQ